MGVGIEAEGERVPGVDWAHQIAASWQEEDVVEKYGGRCDCDYSGGLVAEDERTAVAVVGKAVV